MEKDPIRMTMVRFFGAGLVLTILALLLTGCKTRTITQTEYIDHYVRDSVLVEKIDTIVRIKEHRDSVVLRDSVFVNVWTSADTVYKVRAVWKYRDRVSVKYDTIHDTKIKTEYKAHTDTLTVYKDKVTTEYREKPLRGWQRFFMGCGAGAVLLVAAGGGWWIYRRFRK